MLTDDEIKALRDQWCREGYDVLTFARRIEALATERERERCARVCDDYAKKPKWWKSRGKISDGVKRNQVAREHWASVIAAAIRKGGE